MLLLLLPLWLPFFALGVAVLVVVGLFLAPKPSNDEPASDLEPDADDDGLPDDYVPPFMPPRPVKALPPPRRISVVPAPASVTSTSSMPESLADRDELSQASASCWPDRFPGG